MMIEFFMVAFILIPAVFGTHFGRNHGRVRKQKWCENEKIAYQEILSLSNSDLSQERCSDAVKRCFERSGYAFFEERDKTLIFRPPREDRITSCLNTVFYLLAFGHAYLCFLISRHYASDEIGGSEYNIQFDLEKKLIRRLWIGGGGFVAGDAWGEGIEDNA